MFLLFVFTIIGVSIYSRNLEKYESNALINESVEGYFNNVAAAYVVTVILPIIQGIKEISKW